MKLINVFGVLIFILSLSTSNCFANELTVTNKDSDGNYISAHGGGIYSSNGKYFWYGENRYSGSNSGVSMYQSSDLLSWKNLGVIFHSSDIKGDSGEYFLERPKIIYNKLTHKYVMWFHVESKKGNYKSALAGVATSDALQGPYHFKYASRINKGKPPINGNYVGNKLANSVNKKYSKEGQMSRDLFLYKDDSNLAYLISSSEDNLTLIISELTPDYLHTTGKYIRVAPGGYNEAPVMFKHGTSYFLVSSATTGWKPNKARLFNAIRIFGYWKKGDDFSKSSNPDDNNTTFHSQGSNVFKYKNNLYFMADKWDSKSLSQSGYLFKEIHFNTDGEPFIK